MAKNRDHKKDGRLSRLIGAHCSIAGGLPEAARRGAELGCTAIQLFTKNSNQWEAPPILPKDALAFQKGCLDGGIKLAFAHSGYLINLASQDEAVHSLSYRSMLLELERAEALELPFVVVHPGSHKGAGEMAGILQVAATIESLMDETEGFRVHIVLETTAGQGRSIGYRFGHFSEIFSRLSERTLKRIGVCVDTAHIFAAGYDIRSEGGYKDTWKEFESEIGFEYLRAIHLNDSAKELGSRVDRHESLGKGYIGLRAFDMLLNDRRFAKAPMVIETPKGETAANDKRNLKIVRELIKGPVPFKEQI